MKQPVEGFIKIETEEDPKQIELDASQVAAEAPALQENYGISHCKDCSSKQSRNSLKSF